MKDWKAEYDKLNAVNAELKRQLEYERQNRERREVRADEIRDKFKELLIDVLGR